MLFNVNVQVKFIKKIFGKKIDISKQKFIKIIYKNKKIEIKKNFLKKKLKKNILYMRKITI